ncbi:NADP-dependent isocitrate dehydrogenase [Eubacteriales bacterium OttesenSCG-928-M02]|nr:NADP-dependent isocitrate dehydrogenase [Eubacteriales bacterium OttesenSCG-928-M02]
MAKIPMKTPLVEMDGDEMTRIIWQEVKDQLLYPYIDLKTEYYDLGLPHRDETDDKVTQDAADANKRLGVGVKCATITATPQRQEEYGLKRLYPSPNATIRATLDGTIFRAPILAKGIDPLVPTWKKPITVARHAYGDIYKGVEILAKGPGSVKVIYEGAGGEEEKLVHQFTGDGVTLSMHNTKESIESFARACFGYGASTRQNVLFGMKDTILKVYDGYFVDIFKGIFEGEYKDIYEDLGITYTATLVDDAVAQVMKSEGGFIWACKNYDGDTFSDMVATAFGSLGMMTSVLVSPDGNYEYEAAHGTVTRHYYKHLAGEETSTNAVATIFAWTGALQKRGELDDLPDLVAFSQTLEKAVIATIEGGKMTGDLAAITKLENPVRLNTVDCITAFKETLDGML